MPGIKIGNFRDRSLRLRIMGIVMAIYAVVYLVLDISELMRLFSDSSYSVGTRSIEFSGYGAVLLVAVLWVYIYLVHREASSVS